MHSQRWLTPGGTHEYRGITTNTRTESQVSSSQRSPSVPVNHHQGAATPPVPKSGTVSRDLASPICEARMAVVVRWTQASPLHRCSIITHVSLGVRLSAAPRHGRPLNTNRVGASRNRHTRSIITGSMYTHGHNDLYKWCDVRPYFPIYLICSWTFSHA